MKKLVLLVAMMISSASFATPNGGWNGSECIDSGNTIPFCHVNQGTPGDVPFFAPTDSVNIVCSNENAQVSPVHWPLVQIDGEWVCQNPETPEPPQEECPNCPTGTSGSASYTLEIEMGGFRDGIYVCEVGFNAHKCLDKGRDPKGDHIVIGSGSEKVVITADTNNPTQFSFEDAQSGGTAKVYLNSANYGAAYYVKYCYDYTKVVVGDAEYLSGVDLLGNLTGSVTLNVGDTGGYYNHAGVTGNISVQCSDASAEVTPIALDDNLSQEVLFDHIFDLNGPVNTPLVDGCRFTIEFEETKRSFVRQLKDDNSTYSATVNTGVNYVMELLY